MHPFLNVAVKAARRAGQIINRASLEIENLQVSRKGQSDYVTQVDRAAEDAIKEILLEAYPTHSILAEESGTTSPSKAKKAGEDDFQWIIDPLDGTTNFIHGFPQYAISIALTQNGQLAHGVIYDPMRNEIFTASKGRGAYLNDRRIRVSRCDRLADSLIGTGFPYRVFDRVDQYMGAFKELTEKTAGMRRPGAAALDLAYVAAGRLDGFWEFGLSPWDMAAGTLMILEAGGFVTDLKGDSDYLNSGDVVAGAPKIHPPLLQIVQKHLTKANA
ncbi:MAG: inositol monophosphatase family protein [Fluviibacter sp.]